jgi:ribosomal-protein-alanine N-acetyltransferase
MKAPHELFTERLTLRAPRNTDAEAVFQSFAASPAVTRYVAWPRHRSVEDSAAFLAFSAREWANWPAGPYLIFSRASGELLGSTGFGFTARDQAETGYVLAENAWGHGYATEALRAVIAIARNLWVTRFVAHCHPDHVASIHVLEKCGFVLDPALRELHEFPNLQPGRKQPVLCYVRFLDADPPDQAER